MGAAEARALQTQEEPGMVEVPKDDPQWSTVQDLLLTRSGKQASDYTFKMKGLWRVRRGPVLARHECQASELKTPPTQLFHGTSWSRAEKIAKEGFRLPKHSGLYGAGCYFASNPRKSASYAPEPWAPFLKRWGTKGFWSAVCDKDVGQMLVCDVYLGRCKTDLWGSVRSLEDLKGGAFSKAFSLGDYDSVYEPGVLSHDEYIVYREFQAIPRYFIEFEYVREPIKTD
mmetsp:Transcript_39431/g.69342  ORF Transcript_39431/g.69342 Transcript_39431/m.69342 type:complete len:228 (-) Transcript_39431:37-720(-)